MQKRKVLTVESVRELSLNYLTVRELSENCQRTTERQYFSFLHLEHLHYIFCL